MKPQDFLNPEHPSYGCEKAVFLFRLNTTGNIISVEANNGFAVACLERYSIHGQRVSDYCILIGVVRGFTSVGVRNDGINEIPFVDFVIDIVDKNIVESDVFGFECFKAALSEEESSYLKEKTDLLKPSNDSPESLPHVKETPDISIDAPFHPAPELAKRTLVSLGFSKKEVDNWAKKFNAFGMLTSEVVKAGCQQVGRDK